MPVGIEKLNFYSPSLWLDMADLGTARGRDVDDLKNNLLLNRRAVNPIWEDTVTMAVNAAKPILTEQDKQDIELLIVGTEGGVDFGKPIGTWAHHFLGINPNVRTYETKHACYSATAGYHAALGWLASPMAKGRKALVIATDFSRNHPGEEHEPVLGGVAVAMLVSNEPRIVDVDVENMGCWSTHINDTFRPTSIVEMGNGEESLYSYIDALEGSFEHFQSKVGDLDYPNAFKKHVYHMPFGGMTFQAHRTLLSRFGIKKKKEVRAHWEEKVKGSLHFSRNIGSCYSGSTFVGMSGHLASADDIEPGDQCSVFVYGSGCQGEFYRQTFLPEAKAAIAEMKLDEHLEDRHRVTVEEYDAVEALRETYVDKRDVTPSTDGYDNWYDRHYKGSGLLVLKEVKNYHRHYDWS